MSQIEKLENIQIHGQTHPSKNSSGFQSGGPAYPCLKKYKHLLQYSNGNKAHSVPKAVNLHDIQIIDTPLLWCGQVHPHYGHFICEYISRIIVYKESKIKGKLCFSVTSLDKKINYWFWQIIEHFGYSEEDVFFVDKPIIAKTLYVAPQNEMIIQKEFTSEYYLDLLDKNYPPKPLSKKRGIVYISRSQKFSQRCKSYCG